MRYIFFLEECGVLMMNLNYVEEIIGLNFLIIFFL